MDLHQHHHSSTNPNPDTSPGRPEAERLMGIAEKLLQNRDLTGSREFALLAQETEPLLEGSDQILAITDVLLASERRVVNNRHHDWYAILQTNRFSLSSDPDLLKKNYRRLALLLHPDKNRFPLSDSAFKLVADAWAVLSDPSRRGLYDHELNVYEKVELHHQPPPEKDKLPVRRGARPGSGLDTSDPSPIPMAPRAGSGLNNKSRPKSAGTERGGGGGRTEFETKFWTACPYCYVLYEYPRAYEDCCLRCQNCERAFHATVINSLPPVVPGKEAYYCCWGFFPLGFSLDSSAKVGSDNNNSTDENNAHNPNSTSVFPNWMPAGMFNTPVAAAAVPQGGGTNLNMGGGGIDISDGGNKNVSGGGGGYARAPMGMAAPGSKKRGRPRKNP